MTKKVKLVLTLDIEEGTIIDEFMVKRILGQLGEVVSYSLSDFKEGNDNSQPEIQSQEVEITQISEFINEANKIYFGSLSIDNRKDVALAILHISNLDKLGSDQLKQKFSQIFTEKFEIDSAKVQKLMNDTNDTLLFDVIRTKFLEGDLAQMIIYIWEKILSKGEEEDDFEIGLVENLAEKFSIESQNFNEIKKNGLDRAKISKGIQSVLSGKNAYNKLKAFEKCVLLALMLAECSTIGGKIAPEESSQLKKILSEQLSISSNQATVILEKKLSESLLKKVEQVEVYREKYELVEFLWERVLSTEAKVDEGGMELIRKMIRRLDISDIESEGARKEAEENLGESSE
ncbi:MAG: hypothetical protein CMM92_00300 [Rickettsiales bacterium]|nr:hypothetical protein [Rickettsiales bacterium]RPG16281.1 MAG: hypothetical protein CBD55_000300 [Pelagibacteraceae bacterium TMED195]|tara:strand:- start:1543 stop:2580 length:1038 start_codon:yes stop_codon:yes gene_type:complete